MGLKSDLSVASAEYLPSAELFASFSQAWKAMDGYLHDSWTSKAK